MNDHLPGVGIVSAMLTPLHSDETVDVNAVKKMVNRMTEAGIHGIFTMATSGECARLAPKQQDLLIETVVEANAGKSTLYIGVSGCGTKQAIRNIRRAEKAGADVIVSTLPYYYGAVTLDEQISYFKELADHTDLPILMYNIPGCVGYRIEVEAAKALRDIKNIAGIKDSSGDIEYFDHLLSLQNDNYRVLCGVEFQCARVLKLGASGVVPSLSNIYPKVYMELWNAAQRGDYDTVDMLQEKLNRINSVHKKHQGRMAVMACRKVLMAYEGLGEEYITSPYVPVPDNLRQELLSAAAELKLS